MNSHLTEATYYIKTVGVALLAASVAYVANRLGQKTLGRVAKALFSPFVEEMLKTLLALLFAASVLLVHTAFGIVEAITDVRHSRRPITTAALAVATHILFGAVTVLGRRYFSIYAGISASVLLHMLWNSYVYDLVNLQRKD
ncbi:MAG: hypothetical protein Q8S19_04090 [Bacillota bacterium]|nr:hypothetical protein [Bacillota bacterium]